MSEHISKFAILKQFTIKNSEEVHQYLRQHPDLEAVLQEADERIRALFPDADIELKVVRDIEYPSDKTLMIYIWTNIDIDNAWQRLRQIEGNWYLKLSPFIQETVSIDVR